MDFQKTLLRNDIRHLRDTVDLLSLELVNLKEFIKLQFGTRYLQFYENKKQQNKKSKNQSKNPRASTSQHNYSTDDEDEDDQNQIFDALNCDLNEEQQRPSSNSQSDSDYEPVAKSAKKKTIKKKQSPLVKQEFEHVEETGDQYLEEVQEVNTQEPIKYIKSRRSGLVATVAGYVFIKNQMSRSSQTIYYNCDHKYATKDPQQKHKNCAARMTAYSNGKWKVNCPHNHPPDQNKIKELELNANVKSIAGENVELGQGTAELKEQLDLIATENDVDTRSREQLMKKLLLSRKRQKRQHNQKLRGFVLPPRTRKEKSFSTNMSYQLDATATEEDNVNTFQAEQQIMFQL